MRLLIFILFFGTAYPQHILLLEKESTGAKMISHVDTVAVSPGDTLFLLSELPDLYYVRYLNKVGYVKKEGFNKISYKIEYAATFKDPAEQFEIQNITHKNELYIGYFISPPNSYVGLLLSYLSKGPFGLWVAYSHSEPKTSNDYEQEFFNPELIAEEASTYTAAIVGTTIRFDDNIRFSFGLARVLQNDFVKYRSDGGHAVWMLDNIDHYVSLSMGLVLLGESFLVMTNFRTRPESLDLSVALRIK